MSNRKALMAERLRAGPLSWCASSVCSARLLFVAAADWPTAGTTRAEAAAVGFVALSPRQASSAPPHSQCLTPCSARRCLSRALVLSLVLSVVTTTTTTTTTGAAVRICWCCSHAVRERRIVSSCDVVVVARYELYERQTVNVRG